LKNLIIQDTLKLLQGNGWRAIQGRRKELLSCEFQWISTIGGCLLNREEKEKPDRSPAKKDQFAL
jgi:hypothetical protein